MKLLLDTHTFIWWDSSPQKLSSKALAFCQNPENTLLLSMASIWEIQIKLQLGKLSLNLPLPELIENQQQTNNIELLPINLTHVLTLDTLPNYHKDPFDRLLICQAIVEDAVLLSGDSTLANYPVKLEW
ncbi:MAG: type II toxin-antitoxin system VapC family toxin [Tychonema bourrellyi B0820]|uniref:Type II toxin-antitoxin system VapC family toxin n=1 Tax=Tychonema bourrellyi FEM_GT703 TaxID=2040638 RepID=A0A2G4EX79_9CYAN|nr:type II toxin-antitoxin system VapC family toxin [Tychonema bourrellyi]MDQ2101021.1 type II toxin-antitoxin system VapC family toxin [Tychonema bourrellyi B0820]PHX54143.1 type II toxin-antitoxin system VapC family toxin [Tychonema bourrellyi FEM_GT703]